MAPYYVVTSYNATVTDVQYTFAWTLVAALATFAMALIPFVFPRKSWYSLFNVSRWYTHATLQFDVIWASMAFVVCLVLYILSWTGYLGVLNNYEPNMFVPAVKLGLTKPVDTFYAVCDAILIVWLFSLFCYRAVVYATSQHSLSIAENENVKEDMVIAGDNMRILNKENQQVPLLHSYEQTFAGEKVDGKGLAYGTTTTYLAHSDHIGKNSCLIFLRIFMLLLCVYGFFVFVTIYPYSTHGYLLTLNTFGISATINFVTGIILCTSLLVIHIRGMWPTKKGKNAEENAIETKKKLLLNFSRLVGNTDIVMFSYADAFRNFTFAGHIQTVYVPRMWIPTLGFFWYVTVYELTCSMAKADTATFCIWFVAFVLSIMSQCRDTFIPFFFSAMFFFTTFIYLLPWWVPTHEDTIAFNLTNPHDAYTINVNYMTTGNNCTSEAMQNDYAPILVFSVIGFALAVITILEASMIKFDFTEGITYQLTTIGA
jgi:hypothetical protein